MTDLWRRYWPLDLLALVVLVLVIIFGSVLEAQQRVADERNDRTRLSLCAILDRIPAGADSGVDRARTLDHCGKPHPPQLFLGRPFPTPTVTVLRPVPQVGASAAPTATVTATPPRSSSQQPAPSRSRPPQPNPSPSHSPRPSPSPSRTCLISLLCP